MKLLVEAPSGLGRRFGRSGTGEITAGAPKYTRAIAGTWSTNVMMRDAERELAEQVERSYRRMVTDQKAGGPSRKVGASATRERA